jgi:hypothetical protein
MLDQPPLPEPFPSLPLRYDDDVYQCPITGARIYKDVTRNLAQRASINAIDDPQDQAEFARHCSKSFILWLNLCGWTFRQHEVLPDGTRAPVAVAEVPFITWPVQDHAATKIINCIRSGRDVLIDKSRDMGASWMGLTVFEWFWHFRPALSFLLISRNEDYVDKKGDSKSLFWKVDFLHEHQPRWLLPTGRWLGWTDPGRKVLSIVNADNRSIMSGESTTGDAGRGDRRTAMFIDEHAAFDVNDGFRVLRATRDTTKCRGFNSTPQGANNGFYDVVHNTSARQIRLHWSVHPEKRNGLYTSENGKTKLLDDFRGLVECRSKGEKASRKVRS